VEQRSLVSLEVDGATLGLAGAAQIFRIDSQIDYLRRGKIYKTSQDVRYGVTSLDAQQLPPARLLQEVRGYWGIETRQHHRRDATQGEDHCSVRNTVLARNLSLLRSAAIFLFEHRPKTRRGKGPRAMPGWEKNNNRQPNALIRQLSP
jgi:hypothetical protein